ncbi:phosphotransferase [Pararhizobium sp. YC-54]|uniref:phosphotransferase n=1 Tax=Pararhizobium sp. YC-54 TaxID=2986920 RepID=UPI0021F6CBF8|nr:phosphotransferase [Pararhizobium sp. YC-54]MCV9999342.1 phosphotransferase [Pararhizobium sp. YC-54]
MAVFTELSDADSTAIARAYRMGTMLSVIGIANGDTETTYLFRSEAGEFIVTLFENGAEPLDLDQAFETMDALYADGVPCPKPRRTVDGQATFNAADRLVAVVDFLPGSPVKRVGVEQCEGLGRVMAQIHTTLARKRKRTTSVLPKAPIHGALVHDNIFFLANAVSGVINFRLRHEDVMISEIADVLIGWTLNLEGIIDADLAKAILRGYQAVRTLTAIETTALPGFVLASAARHYASGEEREDLLGPAIAAYKSMTADMFD